MNLNVQDLYLDPDLLQFHDRGVLEDVVWDLKLVCILHEAKKCQHGKCMNAIFHVACNGLIQCVKWHEINGVAQRI